MVQWSRLRLGLILSTMCFSFCVLGIQRGKSGHSEMQTDYWTRWCEVTHSCIILYFSMFFLFYLDIPKRMYLVSLRVFIKLPKVNMQFSCLGAIKLPISGRILQYSECIVCKCIIYKPILSSNYFIKP